MFHQQTPHEATMLKLEQLELYLAEANKGVVDVKQGLIQHQATVASLLGDVAKIVVASNDAIVAHHAVALSVAKAQSANRVIRRLNQESESELEPLQKEIPSGDEVDGGVHLANSLAPEQMANAWQAWPPIARPFVTEVPPSELFPKSKERAAEMDDVQILRMIAFYNDSFGINQSDSLALRRRKVLVWCTH